MSTRAEECGYCGTDHGSGEHCPELDGGEGDDTSCRECGEPCFTDDESGTSHHGVPDDIDYELDADHVAIPEGG